MEERRKYIILSDGQHEYAVIFDQKLAHINVAEGIIGESAYSPWSKVSLRLKAVSAGFVYMPEIEVDEWTGSESLKLKPRKQDQALMRGELVEALPLPPFVPR